MLRNILATLAGLFLGGCVNMALVILNSSVLYPMAPGTDMNDPAAMNAWVATLPAPAFLVVLAAHLGQAFVGAWIVARFAARRRLALALFIGALTALGSAINMVSLSAAPVWMWIDVPLCVAVAYGAWKMQAGRSVPG